MPTLRRIVDILASLGYNQFQLYAEHTFAYSRHETAWRGASPMTPGKANFRASFEPEYRRLWLGQNRVGGLDLSLVTVFGR